MGVSAPSLYIESMDSMKGMAGHTLMKQELCQRVASFPGFLCNWASIFLAIVRSSLYICPNYLFLLTITFQTDSIGYHRSHFGFGVGSIVMDDVYCNGTENVLYDCPHTSLHNCVHNEDASVFCSR